MQNFINFIGVEAMRALSGHVFRVVKFVYVSIVDFEEIFFLFASFKLKLNVENFRSRDWNVVLICLTDSAKTR